MGVKTNVILQDYRNMVDVDGEYCLEDCILTSPTIYQGILDPVVFACKNSLSFTRSKWRFVIMSNGV